MVKLNKLDIPHQWKDEFTKYPHGYSIFEALSKWVDQVNRMVTNINQWNAYLGDFTSTFGEVPQQMVELQREMDVLLSTVNTDLSMITDEVTGLADVLLSHLANYATYLESELGEEHIIRSLPNGVKDEVRVSEGKFVKRVSDEVKLWEIWSTVLTGAESENFYALSWYSILTNFSHESSTNIQFARVNNYQGKGTSSYQEVQETDNYIWRISSAGAVNIKIPKADIEGDFTVAKGQQWLQQKQVTLTYQLAEPEIIDLPEVMSPNTREIVRLSEQVDKLINML